MSEIHLGPFNFKKIYVILKKLIKKYLLLIIIIVIFTMFFSYEFNPLSNEDILYILSNTENNNVTINTKCIGFKQTEDKSFIFKLNRLLSDDKFFKDNSVEKVIFQNLPNNIDDLKDQVSLAIRKQLFIKAILPLIINANMDITKDRNILMYLLNKMPKKELSNNEIAQIKNLAIKYDVNIEVNNLWDALKVVNILLVRVNNIPNSLVLAIAIKETGWGKSRFLKEGNSLFSEWNFQRNNNGIIPLERKKTAKYTVKSYDNLQDATNAFFYNINTSYAYKRFRDIRQKFVDKGKPLDSYILSDELDKYSAEKDKYVESLRDILKVNNLIKYDKYNSFFANKEVMCIYFY